jgi:DNA-binding Lrp family transcriptional regulator
MTALQGGLALVSRPYAELARHAGMSEAQVLAYLQAWQEEGLVKRFGVVVRHHELGFRANAMVVFDVPDEAVETIGRQVAREPGVTLCYQRRRSPPEWRYNLYCMVHGRSREVVAPVIERLSEIVGSKGEPLFSTRRFKQCGARYFSDPPLPEAGAHA